MSIALLALFALDALATEPGVARARTTASAGVHDPRLADLLERQWTAYLQAFPTNATQLGIHTYDDQLDDISNHAEFAWRANRIRWRREALKIKSLDPTDALTRDLFLEEQKTSTDTDRCRLSDWNISSRGNAFVFASSLAEGHPVVSSADGNTLLARYRRLPVYFETHMTNLRRGAHDGLYGNAESVRRVIAMVDAELARPVDTWGVMLPADDAHADWTEQDRAAFTTQLHTVVDTDIRTVFQTYRQFLSTEILPHARDDDHAGLGALPIGTACYSALIKSHTTLERSPEELHATGLAELERIHAEMRKLGPILFATDDLAGIFARLRSDPQLHFSTAAEVEAKASSALAKARAAIPHFFGRLPQAECGVSPIPAHEAPYTTIAYYWPAVPGGEKPGTYFVNTYAPETRPRFEAEVLAFHESIPGHHLQIAIAQELEEIPDFRKDLGATAFIEGWALYTERLADEMGLYEGDLDRMGMYGFDAWRASRLVVDTGMHAMGWSRERAVQFMLANTALAENNIRNEVDRYLTDPGQALAYKTGQLEIWRLRKEAEAVKGKDFDVRGFHDVVLGAGPVSLPILAARVRAWATN